MTRSKSLFSTDGIDRQTTSVEFICNFRNYSLFQCGLQITASLRDEPEEPLRTTLKTSFSCFCFLCCSTWVD